METNQTNKQADAYRPNQASLEDVKRIVRDASHHPTYPRKCLSCGAPESLDGSVPCGH
ncbi:hypothetical protein [Burkholderia stagnalis]|uniref:hypothetical protein n=1 Tax=Burkholderia stagnalis TaxID=1503054 RepID=UPI000A7E958A|nr:hypothetical protein [Burkholderia stagnalis]